MSDTIELLESIGGDASLRHASKEELLKLLTRTEASEALKDAVAFGDSARLSAELGNMPNLVPQISNAPGHEEEPDQDEDDQPAASLQIPRRAA